MNANLDRRSFLRAAALAGGGVAVASAVSSCSTTSAKAGNASGNAKANATASTTLRIGVTDATQQVGLDPRTVGQGLSSMVLYHLYDVLVALDGNDFVNVLAETVQPNSDATEWTVAVRKGVTFHDGTPLTAKDVAYSIATVAGPKSNRASVFADVVVAKIATVDELTVRIPLSRPRGDFREAVLSSYSPVFPAGTTDFTKGMGTGPYTLAAIDGRNVRLTRNKAYWGEQPQTDTLEFIRIDDPTARLNAVRSGAVDYAVGISAVGARTVGSVSSLAVRRGDLSGANALSFAMNQQLAPFDDPRVRKALRLAIDRQAIVTGAFMGMGTVGNDVVGMGLPGYAADLVQRKQDLAQARSLLRAAGVSRITIRACELVPGMLDAVDLFKQQLAGIGVTLVVDKIAPEVFYSDLGKLRTSPFQTFYYSNRPAAVHLSASTGPTSPFNVVGTGKAYWAELDKAQSSVDDKARAAAFTAIEHEVHESGGDILFAFQDQIDLSRDGISGVGSRAQLPLFTKARMT